MLLAYTEDRALRMLVALLAAADPLGRIDAGCRPGSYEPVACEVLFALQTGRRGTKVIDVIAAQAGGGRLDTDQRRAANAFLAAAMDWWASTERMLDVEQAS